jgi:hypothetical protein
MKCSKCGKEIVNIYTWDGKIYGKECWKSIALPEIEKQKQRKIAEWDAKKSIAVEVAKIKDLTKVKNEYKKRIIKDIINFYNEKEFISLKQYNLLTDIFNKNDKIVQIDMEHDSGLIEDEWKYWERVFLNSTGKRNKEAKQQLDIINGVL